MATGKLDSDCNEEDGTNDADDYRDHYDDYPSLIMIIIVLNSNYSASESEPASDSGSRYGP